jgi:hypothetical protein
MARVASALVWKTVRQTSSDFNVLKNVSCLVAERCWDRVRWAIEENAWRFDGLRRAQSSRRAR